MGVIPGIGGILAARNRVTSVSFQASATSLASTITVPADAVGGDLAVLLDIAQTESDPAPAEFVPTGFTKVATTDNRLRMVASYSVLTGSPGGTTITGLDSTYEAKILLIFRPNSPINAIVSSTWNAEGAGANINPALQTVVASGQDAPLICFGAAGRSGSTAPAYTTNSPALTSLTVGGTARSLRFGYRIDNSSPSDQSVDIGAGGSGVWVALASGFLRLV
jgi:hypothetical protein